MSPVRVRRLALLAAIAIGAAACSDDDDGTTPPTVTAPATPSGVSASAQSQTVIRVTWAASSGATSYTVQRAGATGDFATVTTTTATTYDDAGLTASTAYRYRVSASNTAGASQFSGEVSATTQAADAPPPAPTNVSVAVQTSSTVRVSWDAVAGATGYIVQRAEGVGGAFSQVAGVSGDVTQLDDAGLTAGTTYRYRVATLRNGLTSGFSAEGSGRTTNASRKVSGAIAGNVTWFRDTTYVLSGFVTVPSGAVLNIQDGTQIVGDLDVLGSSLWVLRGGRINALGTATNPIVFTSAKPAGQRNAGDWGGITIIGNATVNRPRSVIVEGSNAAIPGAPQAGFEYTGGTDDSDNSGTLRYVRAEFAGFGVIQDVELNTFTFAAVGSGTTMEYLQALRGLDDNFEWFGGTADAKYLVSYEAADDHFDASEGFRGRIQYMIAMSQIQLSAADVAPGAGGLGSDPRGIENDGCATGGNSNCPSQLATPYNNPIFANFTIIGGPSSSGGNDGAIIRRGSGGHYVNGVIARYPRRGLDIRDTANARVLLTLDSLSVRNVYFASDMAAPVAPGSLPLDPTAFALEFGSQTSAQLFTAVPAFNTAPANGNALDFSPAAGAAIATGGLSTFTGALAAKAGTFITPTAYRGAAAPGGAKWWQGWTNWARN